MRRTTRMIRLFSVLALACLVAKSIGAQVSTRMLGTLPEPVANNAVVEGFSGGQSYVYSFAGIDATKQFDGIHLRSYRINVETGFAERLGDVPDTLGKVAAGASRIGDIIYVIGGYHVYADGSEKSSNRVHRFSISTNEWLSDAADLPIAIDDHVQAVWRDSLIYVVTGWSDSRNVLNVQVYDPARDAWSFGTTPMTPRASQSSFTYAAFGAAGAIHGDTLYYFGGAKMGNSFPITAGVRRGVINPVTPTEIVWSAETPDANVVGYRMAATSVGEALYWLGGSEETYNYDGIAYETGSGVPPANRVLRLAPTRPVTWTTEALELPMDLRGVGELGDSLRVLVGGMKANQEVSDEVVGVFFDRASSSVESSVPEVEVRLSPNPATNQLEIRTTEPMKSVALYDAAGRLLLQQQAFGAAHELQLVTAGIPRGITLVSIAFQGDAKHALRVVQICDK